MEYYQKLVNLDEAEYIFFFLLWHNAPTLFFHRARLSALRGAVAHEDPSQQDYQQNMSATRRLETQRRHAMELRDKILLAVQDLEIRMDLRHRWTPGCAEWSEAAVLVANRRYQRALDKLQGLVIARLFELTKCHMSGTGAFLSCSNHGPCPNESTIRL
jgi:uncharacterized NAD(P)/FAD-binding protein YdhS